MPELRGRRLGDGEQTDDESHLDISWSHRDYRSYEYGTSKQRLRPAVPEDEEKVARIIEQASKPRKTRKAPVKRRKRKKRKVRTVHDLDMCEPNCYWCNPPTYTILPAPDPAPEPWPPPRPGPWLGDGQDPRLTGEDIEAMLDEYT